MGIISTITSQHQLQHPPVLKACIAAQGVAAIDSISIDYFVFSPDFPSLNYLPILYPPAANLTSPTNLLRKHLFTPIDQPDLR